MDYPTDELSKDEGEDSVQSPSSSLQEEEELEKGKRRKKQEPKSSKKKVSPNKKKKKEVVSKFFSSHAFVQKKKQSSAKDVIDIASEDMDSEPDSLNRSDSMVLDTSLVASGNNTDGEGKKNKYAYMLRSSKSKANITDTTPTSDDPSPSTKTQDTPNPTASISSPNHSAIDLSNDSTVASTGVSTLTMASNGKSTVTSSSTKDEDTDPLDTETQQVDQKDPKFSHVNNKVNEREEEHHEDADMKAFNYAYPTEIPSVVTREVTMDSIGGDKDNGVRISLLMPVASCCSYCLKLQCKLYPFPVTDGEIKYSFSDENLFCMQCINSALLDPVSKQPKRAIQLLAQTKVPHPQHHKLVMISSLSGAEMRSVNQKYGGIVFWDSQGYEYLFQLEERHSAEFNKWKHEWIKHLSKLKIRVWIDTISLSYFIDQKHTLELLSNFLLIKKSQVMEYINILEKKRQLIFYGPPGTGKTFVAQEIAEYVALCKGERKGRVSIVQFHPTYSYEDFVEGYRPIRSIQAPSEQHSLAFQLVSGPFKELAEEAQKNPQSNFVLIIDELNRGNVAKIFGELFFLLEYRDRNILLQYSNSKFSLPTNLFIIATMNTVDRSLSKLDKALRRRFFFVPFLLDREPVKDLLSKWLDRYKPSMKYVAQVVDKANEMLSKIDEGLSIGPSHFMTSELNKEWFELIWKYSIVPEVEDSFEDEQRLKEFAALPRTFLLDDLREE